MPGIGPSSMSTGSVPTTLWARTRARGLRPSTCALSFDISSTAAAPSVICEEFPAVMLCSGLKAGASADTASYEVLARMPSSAVIVSVCPFIGTSTGMICEAR